MHTKLSQRAQRKNPSALSANPSCPSWLKNPCDPSG